MWAWGLRRAFRGVVKLFLLWPGLVSSCQFLGLFIPCVVGCNSSWLQGLTCRLKALGLLLGPGRAGQGRAGQGRAGHCIALKVYGLMKSATKSLSDRSVQGLGLKV